MLMKQGHKKYTLRSSMKRRRRQWRNCKTMTPGSSSRSKSWSCRPSLRSSGRTRRCLRRARWTSGTTSRSDTPRRRGSCSEPRPRPTPGRAWATSGGSGAPAASRAPAPVPGPPTPAPPRPRPAGPARHRTPGHLLTGTRRRRKAKWTATGTPRSSASASSLNSLLLFYSKPICGHIIMRWALMVQHFLNFVKILLNGCDLYKIKKYCKNYII